ncbi:MFS transporter [Rhodococcus fascians]|nr:MFS transporter [Rhodococcus fascians]MBY3999468.1 MFS transporter [Rhodococcus fascians]MBY4005001.1 MFS transporter [Rhodococcus fascians]MBY4010126.1 MFS transporter [Rhodococcus fascians]MBY4020208.1 MFS transporter [Rhodococcus fascians]
MSETEGSWFRTLCLISALLQAVYVAVRVLLSYRILELGEGGAAIGAVTALYSLAPLLIAIPLGRLVDGRYLSLVLRTGILLSLAAVLVVAVGESLQAIALGSIVLGVGNLLTAVGSQTYIPRRTTDAMMDRRFGSLSLWVSLGQACGLPVAGVVASSSLGTSGALHVMAAAAASALALSCSRGLTTTYVESRNALGRAVRRDSTRSLIANTGMRAAILSSLMVLTAIDLMGAYLPVLGAQKGWTVLTVTTILTARSVASIASRALLPVLLATVARRHLLLSGTAASVAPVALLPLAWHPSVAVLLLSVAGFFWGIAQPLTMTWVTSLAAPASRGAALSLRMTGNRLGQVLIPACAGALTAITGTGAVFVTTSVMLAIAAMSTWKNA